MTDTRFTSYALLGSGRLAGHLQHYLKILELPARFWSRNADVQFNSVYNSDAVERLKETVAPCSHILLAVKDDALNELAAYLQPSGKTLVHFSGAVRLPGVSAAHPLMTFGAKLEDGRWYRDIPFVTDEGVELGRLLPHFPNRSWQVLPELRPLYHSLCSLAANASFLLWEQIGNEFEKKLQLPRDLLAPLLHQVVDNFAVNQQGGFTGPVARGDWQVVCEHLHALRNSRPELLAAYRDYLRLAASFGHHIPAEMI